jgi:iron(III) transport system ATP-binding protein
LSFELEKGEILSLLGPSGGGKTTLIKCIYGLEDLASGEIVFNKQKILGPAYNLMPGYKDMKLVSQDYYVLDNHSVEENIKDMLVGLSDDYKARRNQKLLKLLDLVPLKDLKAKNLSSGQKQRVAIARALALFPKLLLLDEPFSNLDKILKDKLFDFIIKEVRKKHCSVILITHQGEEALKYSDYIGVVINGKIAQLGSKESVYYKPRNLKVAKLMGDYNILAYDEFEASSSYFKQKKKTLLRPDRFAMNESKKGSDLVVNYVNHFFNGKCYEVLTETNSGKELLFYSSVSTNFKDKLFLSVK